MVTDEPVVLALLASAGYGLALVITQFGLRYLAASDGALVSVPTTTLLFWLLAPFFLDLRTADASAATIFALVGLFFPAAVTVLTFKANRRLGPTISGALGSTTPLFATAVAVLALGEHLTPLAAAATLIVVAGTITLVWQRKNGGDRRPVWLLLPLAASLIGYSVSVFALAMDARFRRRIVTTKFDRRGVLLFAVVGVCNGTAVFCTYAALNHGAVLIVAPIVATYPLFSLLFGGLLLPNQPAWPRLFAGTALIVTGIVGLLLAR
jgi:drug/metabolite transporter (DMT)-like permease